jgi:hypothetical protein
MHFTTAEKWSQQNYEVSGRRMGSIRLTISKLRSKQSSKVELKNPVLTSPPLTRTSPPRTAPDLSENWPGLVQSTQNALSSCSRPNPSSQPWFLSYEAQNWMKLGYEGHLNTRNTFPTEVFPKFKDFPFSFGLTQKPMVWRWTHKIFK